MKAVWLLMFLIQAISLPAHGNNLQDRTTFSPLWRFIHHQLLSELRMALNVAIDFGIGGEENSVLQECLDAWNKVDSVWTSADEDHVLLAEDMLREFNYMYHEQSIRDPEVYYSILVEVFPKVYGPGPDRLGKESLTKCLKMFNNLHLMYEEYRKKFEIEHRYPPSTSTDETDSEQGDIMSEEAINMDTEVPPPAEPQATATATVDPEEN